MLATPPADCLRGLLVGRSLVEFALRYCQVLIELAKPRQIAGGQLHPRRGMTAGPEEEIALLMRRWEQVKAGDGAVVLIGGEPGNREIAPREPCGRGATDSCKSKLAIEWSLNAGAIIPQRSGRIFR